MVCMIVLIDDVGGMNDMGVLFEIVWSVFDMCLEFIAGVYDGVE